MEKKTPRNRILNTVTRTWCKRKATWNSNWAVNYTAIYSGDQWMQSAGLNLDDRLTVGPESHGRLWILARVQGGRLSSSATKWVVPLCRGALVSPQPTTHRIIKDYPPTSDGNALFLASTFWTASHWSLHCVMLYLTLHGFWCAFDVYSFQPRNDHFIAQNDPSYVCHLCQSLLLQHSHQDKWNQIREMLFIPSGDT